MAVCALGVQFVPFLKCQYAAATRPFSVRNRPFLKTHFKKGKIRASNASSTAVFAKEMELVSAKEALLLAIKDAGGFQSVALGRENESNVIEIMERVLTLERLNPTPRPTTSPFLEGLWKFEWIGDGNPALLTLKFLLKNLPSTLIASGGLTLDIADGITRTTYNLKLFGTVESSFILTTNLSVEGPLRLKEQFVDGIFPPPTVQNIPSQFQGIFDQFQAAVDRLPEALKDSIYNGFTLPLGGNYQRLLLVTFLDEDLMIGRDATGVPDVLTRVRTIVPVDPIIAEYQS